MRPLRLSLSQSSLAFRRSLHSFWPLTFLWLLTNSTSCGQTSYFSYMQRLNVYSCLLPRSQGFKNLTFVASGTFTVAKLPWRDDGLEGMAELDVRRPGLRVRLMPLDGDVGVEAVELKVSDLCSFGVPGGAVESCFLSSCRHC